MNGHRWKRLPVSLALGLGLIVAVPGAAAAADGWQPTKNVAESRFDNGRVKACGRDELPRIEVRGCFQAHAEVFWLKDRASNGNPVVIRWRYHNKNTGKRRAGDIYNTHGKAAGWTLRNKSFAENQTMRFRVCEANVAQRRVYDCGPWVPTGT